MDIYRNSLILCIISRIWNWTCEKFKGGIFYRFFSWVASVFKHGLLMKLFSGGDFFKTAWETSIFRRTAQFCLNIIPGILNKLYVGVRPLANSAIITKCLDAFSRYPVPVLCIMALAMLIIPQSRWNNMYSLAIAVLALLLYWCGTIRDRERKLTLESIGPFPCIYALVVFLSLVWSDSFSLSIRFFFFAVTCMITVVVFTNSFDSEKKLLAFVMFVAAGLFIGSAYAFLQRMAGVAANGILTDLSLNPDMPGRVYSFFENPNSYANLLVYFSPLMLCMFFFAPKVWQRLIYLLVFLLCSAALIMTYSRGGWLAYAFSMFILMCLLCPRWIPLVIAAAVFCLPFLPDTILNRLLTIFNMSDSSTYTRTYIYAAMLRIIGHSPIFGVGLGTDTVKHSIEIAGAYTAEAVFIHGHNIYFQIWAESGILGLASFLLSVFFPMREGARRIKKNGTSPLLKGIIAGCVSGLAGSLFFGITDYPWSYPRVMVLFWLLFALLCSAVAVSKDNEKAGIYNGK